jgi:hypothetical protein
MKPMAAVSKLAVLQKKLAQLFPPKLSDLARPNIYHVIHADCSGAAAKPGHTHNATGDT